MLLRFTVENFMSFKERSELSLAPSLVRRHPNHVIKGLNGRNDISVLKAAMIYGANASGKSNLIKAIKHAQVMVNEGVKSGKKLPYIPYKLSQSSKNAPTRFEFEIKVNKINYAYGFSFDQNIIHEEWLYEINKVKEILVFERTNSKNEQSIKFGDISFQNNEHEMFLNFTAKGTPENRLFLNECSERNVISEMGYIESIVNVLKWFEDHLNIVFPKSKYYGLEMNMQNSSETGEIFSKILKSFDTGINELKLIKIDFDRELVGIPEEIKKQIEEDLEPKTNILVTGPNNTRYQLCMDSKGHIGAFKLMTSHIDEQGKETLFDIKQESDGTQRLIDIASGLLEIFSHEKVYIIDELDRSLHPDITTSIIHAFLNKTANISSQLIVTTHESNLLNQDLVRKDEIWFVEKNKEGASSLYSLEEFQPRFDKNLRRGYLSGRFGAVPMLPNFKNLSWMNDNA